MKTVEVWRVSLDRPTDEVATLHEILDARERARAAGFVYERDRRRYVVARATLRTLLGEYTSTYAERVPLCVLPGGKPALVRDGAVPELHFNLSHCGELALFAFADREIGIDIERLASVTNMSRVAAHFFSPDEVGAFQRLAGLEQTRFFFRTWVRKEAYLKATGDGFAVDPARLRVADPPASDVTFLDEGGTSCVETAYQVHDLPDIGDHVAALAIAGCAPGLVFR